MIDILTIQADDPNVLTLYHKQKLEFHFQQKSDNDFVMFLLDTAMRVISIVQHLAPVLEAVSVASADQTFHTTSDDSDSTVAMDTEPLKPPATNQTQTHLPEQTLSPLIASSLNNSSSTLNNTTLNTNVLNSITNSTFNSSALNCALNSLTNTASQNSGSSALNCALNSLTNTASQNSSSSALNCALNSLTNTASQNTSSLALQSLNNTLKNTTFSSNTFSAPANTAPAQLDATPSLADFDKTISQLQQELDSVSQSLVCESTKTQPSIKSLNNMTPSCSSIDNMTIMKRLQQNFKDSKELTAQHPSKELDNLTLIKTIQDSIVNRVNSDDVLKIKQEVELSPHIPGLSQTIYRQETDSRQTTERLQQLMSTLSNTNVATNGSPSAITSTPNTFNQISSTSVLNQISNTGLNQIPNSSALNQISSLTSAISPSLSSALSPALSSALSPVSLQPPIPPTSLKTSSKKNINPLSMLHLQGIQGTTGASIDQAAILSALYNKERNCSVGGASRQTTPDNKPKVSTKTSPNSPPGRRRPFHCLHCLKNFSFKSSLDRHISVIHLGMRRYGCPICAAAFGQKKQLKHHMTTRHGDVIAQLHIIQTS